MLRFRYIAVAEPGKTNDDRASQICRGLQQWLAELDPKNHICVANAYPLANKILIPRSPGLHCEKVSNRERRKIASHNKNRHYNVSYENVDGCVVQKFASKDSVYVRF
jgi:hypothetical protein